MTGALLPAAKAAHKISATKTFRIVKDSPLCLDLYESISTDRGDRCFEIGDFRA